MDTKKHYFKATENYLHIKMNIEDIVKGFLGYKLKEAQFCFGNITAYFVNSNNNWVLTGIIDVWDDNNNEIKSNIHISSVLNYLKNM